MSFQDLILVYWADPIKDGANPKLQAFIDLAMESRYWFDKCHRNCGLYPIGEIDSIKSLVETWIKAPTYLLAPGESLTLYFGFQNDPGWTLPEFHDILKTLDWITDTYSIKVSWLPDNWFDHPGLTPTLTSNTQALEWMEQQIINLEPETINYEFKGAHHEQAESQRQAP